MLQPRERRVCCGLRERSRTAGELDRDRERDADQPSWSELAPSAGAHTRLAGCAGVASGTSLAVGAAMAARALDEAPTTLRAAATCRAGGVVERIAELPRPRGVGSGAASGLSARGVPTPCSRARVGAPLSLWVIRRRTTDKPGLCGSKRCVRVGRTSRALASFEEACAGFNSEAPLAALLASCTAGFAGLTAIT